ncbi:MAG: PhnE/PtxC family ABC transporter permease, partial [Akkermansiaceae bacterium]
EVWTELYLLLAVIISVDIIGAKVRQRHHTIPNRKQPLPELDSLSKNVAIHTLKKLAPRWRLPRIVAIALAALIVISWLPNLFMINAKPLIGNRANSLTAERAEFFIHEITPEPARDSVSWEGVGTWADELWQTRGEEALLNTVAIATIAIVLAAMFAISLLPFASRALARLRALNLPMGRKAQSKSLGWKAIGLTTRSGFIVTRAVPEYIIAYILIGLMGVSAWPLILALAIHNIGILGRLWGEVTENHPESHPRQLMAGGAGRIQVFAASYLPESFNRFLMYLFYRWETCVRETTILGMLGYASIGLQISLSRGQYNALDQMMYFVLLGAAVIFIGDFVSVAARAVLRKA